MPTVSQGNIFQAAYQVQLTIVFGHIGFNYMGMYWKQFSGNLEKINYINDPFVEFVQQPVEWSSNHWLWFFLEQKNHGMTDSQLINALDTAFLWASCNNIKSIATNGIANTHRGQGKQTHQQNDAERAAFLKRYVMEAEKKYDFSVELVNLKDIFMRSDNDV